MAGGFGTGDVSSTPRDIASVVPYREGRRSLDNGDSLPEPSPEDIEAGGKKTPSSSSDKDVEYAAPVSSDTPFFHLDLHAAVKAAESGLKSSQP